MRYGKIKAKEWDAIIFEDDGALLWKYAKKNFGQILPPPPYLLLAPPYNFFIPYLPFMKLHKYPYFNKTHPLPNRMTKPSGLIF